KGRRGESRVKTQRVAAVGSLLVVVAVVGVIVLTSGIVSGSSPSKPTTAGSATNQSRGGSASRRAAAQPGMASVPILVYHVINTPPAQTTAPAALYVTTDEFSAQMQALKAKGWHAVTLDQVQAYWTRGVPLGAGKPIVITFDTGYASQYTNALPILKELGWVGVEDLQLSGLPSSDGGLSDAQIRGLLAAGWELDTQGISHTDLTAVAPAQLNAEVGAARQTLRSRYGVPVNWFTYPLGDYNATVIAAVSDAGYLGASTVNPGWASPQQDRFRLPRLVVAGGTTPAQLLAQIAGAKGTMTVPTAHTGPGLA
ncbi:MAG: polysaccharide deacetylase family protein, partial [Solirubrobacteraceae bacterium]